MMNSDTIAAISTPLGAGGIGVIRLSGQDACEILRSIFIKNIKHKERTHAPYTFESHRLYHGFIHDPKQDRVIDEVMVVLMKGPKSYTREDVVEIQSHSSLVVLSRILELVTASGALPAQPGEFTKRAFLNGRIDLTQAEAVIDIINGKTAESIHYSMAQSEGLLAGAIEEIKEDTVRMIAGLEASIEFPEDVDESQDLAVFRQDLERQVLSPARRLIGKYDESRHLKEGVKVAIVGAPNAGKSSLMNCLTQQDKSIVTPIPGTTRDLVEGDIFIDGFIVNLTDTAGIHETEDMIEAMGIERTENAISRADLVLLVIDSEKGISSKDMEILEGYREKKHLIVFNKSDKKNTLEAADLERTGLSPFVQISSKNKTGIETLQLKMKQIFVSEYPEGKDYIAPNLRHKKLLEKIVEKVFHVHEGLDLGMSSDLLIIDLNDILEFLNQIIGVSKNEEILDSIFSNFCIGK